MSKYKVLIIIIGLALLAGAGVLALNRPPQELSNRQSSNSQTQTANIFNLSFKDYSGRNVALSSFQGKPLVINTWATWCPFCKKELPDFASAQKEFGDQVVIIAIDRAEPLEATKQYSNQLGFTNNLILLLDPSDSFYRAIGGFSMPETIFINKNGETVIHKRGPMDLNEIREKVKQIL